mmetsp:Transcript_25040/g.54489  ORF Transcript_25040/g.54489 Transcript_25040/m.54489 type:complete len:411 (-) Transcript_25040:198-1430(-)
MAPWADDTSSQASGSVSWQVPPTLAELGIPAGCRSDRVAGRAGEMGDHGIDAYAVGSSLLKCSRNGVDPRAHQKLASTGLMNTKGNPPRDPMHLPVSSGLIGQPAGSRLPYDTGSESARSVRSSRSEGSLQKPATLAEAGVAAGVHSYRMAGDRGEVCDPAADHHAHQQLHKTPASMNVQGWEHPHAHFAHLRRVPRTGVSSGLIGQRAGEFYPGHEESPFDFVTDKNYGNHAGYSARQRGYEEAIPNSEFMATDHSQLIKNRRPTPRRPSNLSEAESLRSSRTSDAGISEEAPPSARSASQRSQRSSAASSAASGSRAKKEEPKSSARSRASSVSSTSTAIHLPTKAKVPSGSCTSSRAGSSTTTSYLRGSSKAESSATHSAAESKGLELDPAAIAIDWQDLRTNRRRR